MQSLWEKIRLNTLAGVHSLLDRATEAQSVEVVRQMVRDLESSMRAVESDANEAKGEIRTLTRTIREKRERSVVLTAAIDEILSPDDPEGDANDHAAVAKQVELTNVTVALRELENEFVEAKKVSVEIEEALQLLEARHAEMVGKLDTLERAERKSRAKETAADALSKAREALGSGADKSVDSIVAKINRRADTADAAFEREKGKLGQASGQNEAIADAHRAIAKRKAELAAKASQPVGVAVS